MNMRAFIEESLIVAEGLDPITQVATFLKGVRHMSPGVDPVIVFSAYCNLTSVILMKMVNEFLQHAKASLLQLDPTSVEQGSLVEVYCSICGTSSIMSSTPPPHLESACFNNISCLFKQIVAVCSPPLTAGQQLDILEQFKALSTVQGDLTGKEEELLEFLDDVSRYTNSLKSLLGKRKRD